MYSVFWGECMRKRCSNQITELDPQGNPLERGWCALTSLPLFTVHFLSACALLFNAIPRPSPGFHLLLLSLRQAVDGKTDQSSWNEGACCTVWEEMKSFCYCQEAASSTNAAWRCAWLLSAKQLVNLYIQWQTVEFCALANTQGRWKFVTLLLLPYNNNRLPVNGVTWR